jgi:hypothetical protein
MIAFFRRIRKRLLRQSKVSQYLLYALGEILLVVIGILLALQINTWNEERIERKQEGELLRSLKGEFETNLKELQQSIEVNDKVARACVEITGIIRADAVQASAEVLYPLIMDLFNFNSFDGRIGVSGEIVNSGRLNLLKNHALRAQLVNWLTLLIDCEEDITFRSENYNANLVPFLMKRFPLANGELTKTLAYDEKNYLETYTEKSPFEINLSPEDLMEFENQIWHHKHNHDYVVINERNLKDFIEETLELLEGELRKKDGGS